MSKNTQKPKVIKGNIQGYEEINHPPHYNGLPNGIECIDVIEHFPANIALAIKHLWRAGDKPGQSFEKDLNKALWYIERQKKLFNKNVPQMNKSN